MNKTSDGLLLVTGATGNTGDPTARLLLQRGHRVRALVHRDDARSESLAEAGADVIVGDMLDLDAVGTALRGVTGAYFVYPIIAGLLEATVIFAQEASDAGVEAVVNMSQISARPDAASNAARHHWLAERLLDRAAMHITHLRPTFFAEWLIWFWTRRADEGLLQLPFGNGRHAPIAAEDQAHVIAAILENPAPHNRQIYPLHGPREMNHYEIADAMSRALGIPVRYEPVEPAAFADAITANGLPSHLAQHLRNVAVDYQNGLFAGTNNLVEVVGGKSPMTVEDYVIANKEAFAKDGPLDLGLASGHGRAVGSS